MFSFQAGVTFAALVVCVSVGQAGGCHRASPGENKNAGSNQNTQTTVPALHNMNVSKDVDQRVDNDETWGGPHVQLLMTANGAEIEFDCANGRINSKIKPDSEGNFDVAGTFQREGGPVRSDEDSGRPAHYIGKLVGDTMTFKIQFTDSNDSTETFSVTRGKTGRLWKCR